MASREAAIKNNLNDRARKVGQFDQLTTQDIDALIAFYDFTCLVPGCGVKPASSVDHVKPLSKGGTNTFDNLQLLCVNHNKAKGDEEIDYRKGRIFTGESEDYSYETSEIETANNNYESSDYVNEGNGVESRPNYYPARSRSGRKPKELTILKRRMIADKAEEAEASFGFLVAVRDNPSEPTNLRLVAAQTILDRVFGRATERSIEQKQITIKVIREAPEQRNSISPAPYLALGAGTD
jgi:5-methylcytosine-specific restriction endonuclease McrA